MMEEEWGGNWFREMQVRVITRLLHYSLEAGQ